MYISALILIIVIIFYLAASILHSNQFFLYTNVIYPPESRNMVFVIAFRPYNISVGSQIYRIKVQIPKHSTCRPAQYGFKLCLKCHLLLSP